MACMVLGDAAPVAVTACVDGMARIWCLDTGQPLGALRHAEPVHAVAGAAVGRHPLIITGSQDGAARTWDPYTGRWLSSLQGHAGPLLALACTARGGRGLVVTGGRDYYAHLWTTVSGRHLARLPRHASPVRAITCVPADDSGTVTPVTATRSAGGTWPIVPGPGTRPVRNRCSPRPSMSLTRSTPLPPVPMGPSS